jgi:hypothetical protein
MNRLSTTLSLWHWWHWELPDLGRCGRQEKTLKEQLVGTWAYVSVDTVRQDGSRVPIYGPNPQGLASFDSNGRYILLISRSGQPKFASNNRMEGTPKATRPSCKE